MAVDRIVWKIFLDFAILAVVGFSLLSVELWMEPYHRGYFETDETLRLPYKEQTISEGLLAGIGFALNVLTIIVIEVYRDKRNKGIGEKFLAGKLIPGWVWESYNAVGIFTFGAACQQFTANLGKKVIGRLRPHFFEACDPQPVSTPQPLEYITDYICRQSDASIVRNVRLSFPSAHSSFAMYSAVFFIMYIQTKGKWRGSKLFRHMIQYVVLMGAWYVGLSRVVDHMHHWSDVAAGFAIGAAYAAIVFVFVLKTKKFGLPVPWVEPRPENLPRPVLAR